MKIEKIFEAKTGKTLKEIENLPEEEVQKYYFSAIESVEEFFLAKIDKPKKYEKVVQDIMAKKINGKWNFIE